MLYPYWNITRPHQWLKNTFILSGLIFGHAFDKTHVLAALQAVLAFIFVSSAGYIFNDLLDRKIDIQHPQKKYRAIANNKLSTPSAVLFLFFLLCVGLSLGFYLSEKAFLILISYSVLVIAYSLVLKHVPWIELLCITLGFMLRILIGTWAIDIPPSPWVLVCGFLLALFLILVKRRSEQSISKPNKPLRSVLHYYSESLLQKMTYSIATLCIVTYVIYAFLHRLEISVLFVIIGIGRYLFLLRLRNEQGIELDIANEFFQDTMLLVIVSFWFISILYH
jgi:4-hydroxybenzoate polyprenyltransferase